MPLDDFLTVLGGLCVVRGVSDMQGGWSDINTVLFKTKLQTTTPPPPTKPAPMYNQRSSMAIKNASYILGIRRLVACHFLVHIFWSFRGVARGGQRGNCPPFFPGERDVGGALYGGKQVKFSRESTKT